MKEIKLLSLDLDGTIIDHYGEPCVNEEFFEMIERFKADGGLWAINTGRTLEQFDEVLAELNLSLRPDFLLTCERELHRQSSNGSGWEDLGDWNRRCQETHSRLAELARKPLSEFQDFLARSVEAETVHENGDFIGYITATETEMDESCLRLDELKQRLPEFNYQRNSVYLRFCHVDYHKGSVLAELAHLLQISQEEVIAMGDNYNDIQMLQHEIVGQPACPGNSVEAVKEAVRAADGYVAQAPCSQGVCEALRHYGVVQESAREI